MKATGMVKKIDGFRRFTIPKALRKKFNLVEGDPIEICVEENNTIILRKYKPACSFTGLTSDLVEYNGTKVSKDAVYNLIKLIGITEIPA